MKVVFRRVFLHEVITAIILFVALDRASASPPIPSPVAARDGNNVAVTWPNVSGAVLESSATLGPTAHWQTISETPQLANGQWSATFRPQAAAARFFRVRVGGPPQLEIHVTADGEVLMSWPQTSEAYTLEVSDDLSPPIWRAFSQQPALQNNRYALDLTLEAKTRFFRLRSVSQPAALSAELSRDTGILADDGLTSAAEVTGKILTPTNVASVTAGFDNAPSANFVSIQNEIQSDGTFILDQSNLDLINGIPLGEGPHTLHLRAANSGGAVVGTFNLGFTLDTTPPRISVAPADGQQDVLPRQLIVATFSEPVVIGEQTSTGFARDFIGTLSVKSLAFDVPGRLVLDDMGLRLYLVPAQELPGNTEFQVSLDATRIFDRAGNPAIGPNGPVTFRTANSQPLPGTSLTGWVFDSARAPQGNNLPVSGAKITVVNSPGISAVTDLNGRFELDNVPGGRLLLEVDGTVAKAPSGSFYPSVTKVFDSVAGSALLLDVPIYLPLVPNAAFVSLSTSSATAVANPTQLPGWSLEVPPNAVQRRDGTTAGRLLIAPVPPQRLPAPLPAGVDPGSVITIQAEGGADVFTQPVPLTAPNLEGLPPGSKTVLWDFDHARGEFVPVATATVSADGKTVTTDPGQGVLRPGWHFFFDVVQDTWDLYFARPPKKDKKAAVEEFKRRQLALRLDVGALVLDGTSLIPGCGVVSAVAGGAAGAWRDAVAEPQKGPQESLTRDSLLGTAGASDFLNSKIADGYRRGVENLKSGNFTEASKFMGRAGKFVKGALGFFAIFNAMDDYRTLQEDIDAMKKAIKDPPGDFNGQVLDGIAGLEQAMNDVKADVIQGSVEYLEGLIPIETVLLTYGARPLDQPVPEPDQTRWVNAALEGESHMNKAAALFGPPLVAKINTVLTRAQALEGLMIEPANERVYYRYVPGVGQPVTGNTFTQVRLTLAAGAAGSITAVEPIAGLIGFGTASVPTVLVPGEGSHKEQPIFLYPSEAPDADSNGLPDDIDAVLGNPTRDQVSALRNGLPPEEAGIITLGIIGRLSQRTLLNQNVSVGNTYADLVAGDRVLYGIGGSNALEVIDISRPSAPVKIGFLRNSGFFEPIQGFARGQRLAVTGFGARVFDMTDPRKPTIQREIDYTLAGTDKVRPVLGPNHIVVANGKDLLSFDLATGLQVSSVSLAALGSPTRMELNGDIIYVLTFEPQPNLQFSVTTVRFDDSGTLTFLGEVRPFFWSARLSIEKPFGLAVDDRAAFVGAWLISVDPYVPGFGTIDISDPTKPLVIATPSTNIITGAALLATDNAGHLLATVAGTPQNKVLDVYDVRDLKKTDNRIFSIPLDDPPYAPGFTAGLAVFATAPDIFIARVVLPDTGTQPPTIAEVVLPGGPTLVERRRFGVHVKVTDDVQVARVELLLQGDNVVATDATYPFDLDFLPPTSLPNGQPLTLTVRATDTGGNRTERMLDLTYQAVAPHVASVIPPNGFTTKLPLSAASLTFDKPFDRSQVTASGFDLRGAGPDGKFDTADDVRLPIVNFSFNAENTRVDLDFGNPLPVDHYRLTVSAAQFKDLGGNALDGEFSGSFPSGNGSFGGDFVTGFEVQHVPQFAVDALPFRAFRTDARDYSDFNMLSKSSPMVVIDVNGDGRPDIIRAIYDPRGGTNEYHVVTVTLQNNDGTFADPVTFPTASNPVQVLAGDVNGDGKIDVVTVHFESIVDLSQPNPLTFSVLLGNGDGSFQVPRTIDTGGRKFYSQSVILLGDFTGDGRSDIAQLIPDFYQRDNNTGNITNHVASEVLIYPNTGGSTFGAAVSTPLSLPGNLQAFYSSMTAADLNHDGKLDLIVPGSRGRASASVVMLSNGDGAFTSHSEPLFDDAPADLVLADFTGDGEVDALSGDRFWRGLGGGKFELVNNEGLKSNGIFKYLPGIVADFNGDGRLDYAAPLTPPNFAFVPYQILGIFTNKADGTFGLMTTARLNPNALSRAVGVADLNGDHRPDLLFDGGEGTDIPYFAYALFSRVGGGFPQVQFAAGAGHLGLQERPLLVDLNNDGVPDPVSYFSNPNPETAVATLPSTPDGFGLITTNLVGTTDPSFFVRAIGAGDFNGDGKVDIVVSKFDYVGVFGDGAVYVMLGNGDGTLQKGQLVEGATTLIAVADFTGDGKPDLLSYEVLPDSGYALTVHPGKGDGTFAPPIFTKRTQNFTFAGPVIVGDFNNDGKPDVLVATYAGGGLGIWLNDGAGQFHLSYNTTDAPSKWELLGLGDFNRDGKLDVLMNDRTGDINAYKLVVVPGDGTGKLGAPLTPTPFPGTYNSKAVVADVNHDGTDDVITRGRFPNGLQEARVSLGNGDGTFQPPISFFGGDAEYAAAIMAADFNGDGLIDLFVGQTLLLQKSP